MAELKAYLKEMDMEIVLKRLEARKKNITREDGKLSKRQLATAYRGYHGLESQYQALLNMSNEAMMHVKTKNDHIHQKHVEEMKHLLEKEKIVEGNSTREIRAMREDFRAQLAYKYVYKNHSFKKYDSAKQAKKPRPLSDNPEIYEQVRKQANVNLNTPRPLGSLRQMDDYKGELKKLEFPPIHEKGEVRKGKVNMFGEKTYENLSHNKKEPLQNKTAFPNIESAMGVEVKFRHKMQPDHHEKDSLYSAPAGKFDEKTDAGSDGSAHVVAFDMGQNLLLMRRKEQEKYERQRHRLLPDPPQIKEDIKKEGWRRVLPPTPSRPTSVFPNNTKNSIGMKKLLKREVTEVVGHWTSAALRLEKVEKVKEYDKTQRSINPLPVFDSNRPTSAIIRDFENYRKYQDDLTSIRQQKETDHPIIIRQLSPQPRPESPVSIRRTEYSRMHTPVPKARAQPDAPLRRTDSENIPSVSRTASYKEIPDDLVEPHENALLTAAERIELEKRLRNSGKTRFHDENSQQNERKREAADREAQKSKPRRKLPQTPDHAQGKTQLKAKLQTTKQRILPTPLFNTSILAIDHTDRAIDNVMQANEVLEIPDETNQHRSESLKDENSEINQYCPIAKRKGTPKLVKTEDKTDIDRTGFFTDLSTKPLPVRLARKMNFDYDSFSRTTPDAKKHLEMRAKMRRKIQLKNAKLAEENSQRKEKDSKSSNQGDRPRSRVSFNENVIVFQTI